MSFEEIQFPTDISYGATGGPIFFTDVVATISGHEQRNSKWQQFRAKYNVASDIKTEAQWQALIAFFRARRGKAAGFRFKDWSDYKAISQPLKDLGGNEYQLVKQYVSGSAVYEREISKPVAGERQHTTSTERSKKSRARKKSDATDGNVMQRCATSRNVTQRKNSKKVPDTANA